MQRQVYGVIARRVFAAHPVIDPKCQVGERPDIERPPQIGSQQRIIVKMKRAPQASAKCDDSGEAQQEILARRDNPSVTKKATPPKLVPRPKNAAERKARVARIIQLLEGMYPHPALPLNHRNVWELLVSVILSAQCTDKVVNEVTPGLFRKYPTMQDLANANPAELGQDIRRTGFFNNKSKALIGAAQQLLADFGGEVPKTMEQLLTVPGVARKTANVVLGGYYRIPAGIVVDTHVQRISRRLDLTKHENPVKIEQDLMKIIPQDQWIVFSHRIILHGRALCVARNPKCAECALDPLCYAKDKTI